MAARLDGTIKGRVCRIAKEERFEITLSRSVRENMERRLETI